MNERRWLERIEEEASRLHAWADTTTTSDPVLLLNMTAGSAATMRSLARSAIAAWDSAETPARSDLVRRLCNHPNDHAAHQWNTPEGKEFWCVGRIYASDDTEPTDPSTKSAESLWTIGPNEGGNDEASSDVVREEAGHHAGVDGHGLRPRVAGEPSTSGDRGRGPASSVRGVAEGRVDARELEQADPLLKETAVSLNSATEGQSTDVGWTDDTCVFCAIIDGSSPAKKVEERARTIAFEPLNPVTPGHMLVVPRVHVCDVSDDPLVSAATMEHAAELAQMMGSCNVITSQGEPATQTVSHLHLHVVPRRVGDGLKLPWSDDGPGHGEVYCSKCAGPHRSRTGHSAPKAQRGTRWLVNDMGWLDEQLEGYSLEQLISLTGGSADSNGTDA